MSMSGTSPQATPTPRTSPHGINGNSTYQHANTAILSVSAVEAPQVVTSAEFDERLAGTLTRLGLRPGLLQGLAGIHERRWWDEDTSFAEAAAMAGAKALAESGIDPARTGLMINSSISSNHLEPSAAVEIHHLLGLPTSCLNFDLSNACLGFVNAMHLAGTMIDSGQIEYAVIVDGESARYTQEATIARLNRPETTVEELFSEFATLTVGSGAASVVLGPADQHPGAHRLVGGVARAGTEHHQLCVGDLEQMRTDTKGLLDAGLALAEDAWKAALGDNDWADMDCYVLHQVSSVHTSALCARLGIDPARVPLTFPRLGNIGPASVPITLAHQSESLLPGDRILCMGIGSGLNTAFSEIHW
jgi:3-oxoacyl-[acyl-carrier-protein] synthase III